MTAAALVAALSALSIISFFYGLARIVSGETDAIGTRLDRYATREGLPLPKEEAQKERGESGLAGRLNRVLTRPERAQDIARELARADLKLTPSEYTLVNIASVLACFLLGAIIFRQIVLALPAGVVGFFVPRTYVKMRQRRRLNAFNDQLSDTITLLANSLRSGYSLPQSMELISRELPPPVATEFGRVVREIGLGLSLEQALANMLRRINSDDLDLVVTAINVQHEVGGNLAQILEIIGHTIRERVRIKGEIQVMTSQQRYTGYIISFLPIALAILLFMLNREYMSELFTTTCGWIMVSVGLLGIFAGFMVIRKIVQIEV
ncbi:MAG: type II secretion system F family protein [Anaerolineae bacterium]